MLTSWLSEGGLLACKAKPAANTANEADSVGEVETSAGGIVYGKLYSIIDFRELPKSRFVCVCVVCVCGVVCVCVLFLYTCACPVCVQLCTGRIEAGALLLLQCASFSVSVHSSCFSVQVSVCKCWKAF